MAKESNWNIQKKCAGVSQAPCNSFKFVFLFNCECIAGNVVLFINLKSDWAARLVDSTWRLPGVVYWGKKCLCFCSQCSLRVSRSTLWGCSTHLIKQFIMSWQVFFVAMNSLWTKLCSSHGGYFLLKFGSFTAYQSPVAWSVWSPKHFFKEPTSTEQGFSPHGIASSALDVLNKPPPYLHCICMLSNW